MPLARPVLALIVAAVAVSGVAVGWELHAISHATAASAAQTTNGTLSISAAGTLGTFFPQVASALVNVTPGLSDPLAAQQYVGSITALQAIASLHQKFDVAASADPRLIPQLLAPTYASWEVLFATSPEVLTYDPTVSALAGINSTNWAQKVEQPGLVMGVANASTDPNGYNEIFVLELEGLRENANASTVYSHFFTTPVGSLAVPNKSTAQYELETQVANLLANHVVSSFITYRSYAVVHHLSYISFDPTVGLGNVSSADLASYLRASTSIVSASGALTVVHGGPVAYAVTVPSDAPNATAGALFIHLILSPEGSALLAADGFTPIWPAWSDVPKAVPSILAPDIIGLPATLSGQIP